MHSIGEKNKYMSLLFMKMSQEYFSLGRQGIHDVSAEHVRDLTKYAPNLTHVVTIGLDARYDQVTLIEADTLEEIYNAVVDFRTGAKAKYISIVDTICGLKAPPRNQRKPF